MRPMATPTQDDFIRSLTLAVRPGSSARMALRAPVLSYAKAEPLEQPHHQPVTRAMALFMANILLLGWIGALHVTKVPTLEERHHAALAALELAEPKEQRLAINTMPPETARELIARMKPADLDDLIETGSIERPAGYSPPAGYQGLWQYRPRLESRLRAVIQRAEKIAAIGPGHGVAGL